jgi:hypothetical protein
LRYKEETGGPALRALGGEELEFFEGAGPILTEKTGERAVGEQFAPGLARGAIVSFIGGVTNALDFRATARTGLFVAAVDGHAFAKRSHVFRELPTRFGTQPIGPVRERGADGGEEALDFRNRELLSLREGREFRFKQNLIGVGVADATEEARVGEGPLESMVCREKDGGEAREIRVEYFEPTRIESEEATFPRDDVERSPLLRAGLSPEKRASGKVKGGKAARWGNFDIAGAPVQAAGNHEMKDEPEVVFEADADAFSEAAQTQNLFADGAVERRGRGAQEKWADDANAFERLAENALLKRFDVDDDVGQFGHGSSKFLVISYKFKRGEETKRKARDLESGHFLRDGFHAKDSATRRLRFFVRLRLAQDDIRRPRR